MTPNSSSLTELNQCIQDEMSAMSAFTKILKLEQAALISGETGQLESITQEKSLLIKQLTDLEKIRKSSLARSGFTTDLNGMQDYLASTGETTETKSIWQSLLEISRQAKEFNRTNGILINRFLTRNQAALNILHRKDPSAALYGPNGQSTNSLGSGRGFVAG